MMLSTTRKYTLIEHYIRTVNTVHCYEEIYKSAVLMVTKDHFKSCTAEEDGEESMRGWYRVIRVLLASARIKLKRKFTVKKLWR